MARSKKYDPIRKPTELEIAFCAGFFEGEGWAGKNSRGSLPECRLTQKDPQILLRIRDIYGGYVQGYRGGKNRSFIHYLCLVGSRAKPFLADVYSYCSDRRKAQITAALFPESVESIRHAPQK